MIARRTAAKYRDELGIHLDAFISTRWCQRPAKYTLNRNHVAGLAERRVQQRRTGVAPVSI
jgi:hypothetical protein